MKYRIFQILFFVCVLLLGIANYFFDVSLCWLLLPVIVFVSAVVYGSSNIQSNFFVDTLCESATSAKEFSITFDDGPDATYTPEILNLLNRYNATATFFVIGKKVAGNETILNALHEAGHLIGNHSYTHSNIIDLKSFSGFRQELNETSDVVFGVIGKRMRWFRPPFGVTTPNLAKAALDLNYKVIGWNIRSLDTTADSAETIIARVTQKLAPGSIILLHDSSQKTIFVLEQILNFAANKGFRCVSMEQLLKEKAYHE